MDHIRTSDKNWQLIELRWAISLSLKSLKPCRLLTKYKAPVDVNVKGRAAADPRSKC